MSVLEVTILERCPSQRGLSKSGDSLSQSERELSIEDRCVYFRDRGVPPPPPPYREAPLGIIEIRIFGQTITGNSGCKDWQLREYGIFGAKSVGYRLPGHTNFPLPQWGVEEGFMS